MPKGVCIRHKYTPEMLDWLANNIKGRCWQDIVDEFNQLFNTLCTVRGLQAKTRISNGITGGQFVKGHIPFNKGKKQSDYMTADQIEKTTVTRFHKGHITHNKKPVGSERILSTGYIEVKIAGPNKWKLKHRLIWEKVYGKLKENETIEFIDGNPQNVTLDNLIKVERRQSAIMAKLNIRHHDHDLLETAKNITNVYLKAKEVAQ